MRNWWFVLGWIYCAIMLCGCEKGNKGEELMMTAEKKELLKLISVDEERIEEGKLFEWQMEVLKQYDYAMKYLNDKYPSYEFVIIDCNQKNTFNSFTTFYCKEKSNDTQDTFELYLYVNDQDGSYDAKDNFYAVFLGEAYAQLLLKKLQEKFPDCIWVNVDMNTVQGREYCEGYEVKELFNPENKLTRHTDIFVYADTMLSYEHMAEQIENYIKEQKIYGSYQICGVNSDKVNDAEWVTDDEEVLYKHSFQQFE